MVVFSVCLQKNFGKSESNVPAIKTASKYEKILSAVNKRQRDATIIYKSRRPQGQNIKGTGVLRM